MRNLVMTLPSQTFNLLEQVQSRASAFQLRFKLLEVQPLNQMSRWLIYSACPSAVGAVKDCWELLVFFFKFYNLSSKYVDTTIDLSLHMVLVKLSYSCGLWSLWILTPIVLVLLSVRRSNLLLNICKRMNLLLGRTVRIVLHAMLGSGKEREWLVYL